MDTLYMCVTRCESKCQCYPGCKNDGLFYGDPFIMYHVAVMTGRGCRSLAVRTVRLDWALIDVGQTYIVILEPHPGKT